jgi:diacylglycerol kinase (ATP)
MAGDYTGGARGVLIVANPYSGSLENRRRVAALSEALVRAGFEPKDLWHRAERKAELADPNLAGKWRCVVVAGGDGTVADLINEHPGVPVAVLPLGTENVFAQAFGFPSDEQRLVSAISRGRVRSVDLGRANGRLFSSMVGVGFDGEVIRRLALWRAQGRRLRRVTYWSYVGRILEAAAGYPYGRIELEAEGVRIAGAHAFVFNLPGYALSLPLAPDARDDDGRLNWVVFEKPGFRNLLLYFWAVARRRHLRRGDVHHGTAAQLRITSAEPAPVQVDGDAAGWTPVEMEAVPAALRVIEMGDDSVQHGGTEDTEKH